MVMKLAAFSSVRPTFSDDCSDSAMHFCELPLQRATAKLRTFKLLPIKSLYRLHMAVTNDILFSAQLCHLVLCGLVYMLLRRIFTYG